MKVIGITGTSGSGKSTLSSWLAAQGYPVIDTDAERLSAFIRDHIGIDGHYAFHLPDLGGTHRPLRDPDSSDDD